MQARVSVVLLLLAALLSCGDDDLPPQTPAPQPECVRGADCASGVCSGERCQAPTCSDAVKNGTETDVDCGGGTCPACALALQCVQPTDCQSGLCASERCAAPPTCSDQIKNGAETDVDCGGGTCAPCALSRACMADRDCASNQCAELACGVGRIATLTKERDGWSVFDGATTTVKTWLSEAPPKGLGQTVRGVATIDEQSLAGVRLFILIVDTESNGAMPNLSDAEAQALKTFVLRGGRLAVFYGYRATYPKAVVTQFGVNMTQVCQAAGTLRLNAQAPQALSRGPFGTLPDVLTWERNCHEDLTPMPDSMAGSKAVPIALSDQGHNEIVLIPKEALGAGSGPVLFFADWHYSYNFGYVSPDVVGPEWLALLRNSIAYLLDLPAPVAVR